MQATASEVKELRETIMAFIAAMNDHDVERTLGFVTVDATWYQGSDVAKGHPAIREMLDSLWRSTSDMLLPLDDVEFFVSADGENAATFWRATSTMTGPFQGFAPTGRRAEFRGACHYRMENGKIATHTVIYDEMAIARQFGLLPEIDSRQHRMMAGGQRFFQRLRRR
jgi:predicted ester cyclase